MENFATSADVEKLWRELTVEETGRVESLLEVISNSLRVEADSVGKSLDDMAAASPVYASVVKSVTVDVVARTLMTSTDQEPITQASESALGYSWSGSYLVPGGGLFIKKAELARLGLRRQRFGVMDFYGQDKRDTDYFS